MSDSDILSAELERVAAIESHTVRAWPATVVETTPDGWVLRATPQLHGRGRSNHALVPARPLSGEDVDRGLAQAAEFAARNGIPCGVQVSPMDLHRPLLDELARRGWTIGEQVVVMTAEPRLVLDGAGEAGQHGFLELQVSGVATRDWVEDWRHCDRRPDVEDHVQSVFQRMAGFANFAHAAGRAAGISVELDGIVGLFCIAVAPSERRQGVGKRLVRAMLARHQAQLAYLQVFSRNAAGLALYHSLGFRERYRYCHCVAPASATGRSLPANGRINGAPAGAAAGRDGC